MSGRIRVAPSEERTADNIVFASKREMHRYCELRGLLRAGIIHNLELQVPFDVFACDLKTHKQTKICRYVADFTYQDLDGRTVVEDAKGMRTETYKLKKKLVEAQYQIRIIET